MLPQLSGDHILKWNNIFFWYTQLMKGQYYINPFFSFNKTGPSLGICWNFKILLALLFFATDLGKSLNCTYCLLDHHKKTALGWTTQWGGSPEQKERRYWSEKWRILIYWHSFGVQQSNYDLQLTRNKHGSSIYGNWQNCT